MFFSWFSGFLLDYSHRTLEVSRNIWSWVDYVRSADSPGWPSLFDASGGSQKYHHYQALSHRHFFGISSKAAVIRSCCFKMSDVVQIIASLDKLYVIMFCGSGSASVISISLQSMKKTNPNTIRPNIANT